MLLTATVLCFLNSGCGHVTIEDIPVYVDLHPNGAHFAHTLTDTKGDISEPLWNDMRFGMFCMTGKAFTMTEDALGALCDNTVKCDYVVKTILNNMRQLHMSVQPKIK